MQVPSIRMRWSIPAFLRRPGWITRLRSGLQMRSRSSTVSACFLTSVGFGAEILLQESQTAVTLLLILTVTMAAFTLFCLISGCLARIQRNLEAYAICLLNGSGLANIVLPGFLECMLLLLPPLAVNFVILRPKMVQTSNFVPFFIILGMAGCVFLLSAGLTVWKIGGINIEELMRRKDG